MSILKGDIQDNGAAPDSRIDLETHALAVITFIANRMAAGSAAPLRERFGLSVTEARIVFLVGTSEAAHAAALVRQIGLDKAAISRGVSRLVELGLLVSSQDPDHAARHTLTLTETGRAGCNDMVRFNFGREAHFLSVLSEKERAKFLSSLQKLLANVEETTALSRLGRFW